MKLLKSALLAAATLATLPAFAQQPPATPAPPARQPPPRRPEIALAREAVDAAIAACAAQNLRVTGAVVDAAGNPLYVYVPDGYSARTGDIATRKGITVVITGKPASQTEALIKADPELAAKVAANPRTVTFGGAVPLMVGDTLIGAIATSGASAEQDEACAKAGADKVAARLK
jgi:uncharacterized protein GlcG (DUF336 family)